MTPRPSVIPQLRILRTSLSVKPTTLDAVFRRTRDDNQVALSIEDARFMEIMKEGLQKDSNSSWRHYLSRAHAHGSLTTGPRR